MITTEQRIGSSDVGAISFAIKKWSAQAFLRSLLTLHFFATGFLRWLRSRKNADSKAHSIVLTGTFYAENWILNHLRPLAASEHCSHVWLVSNFPLPDMPKVTALRAPKALRELVGETPARLLLFVITVLRQRPDFVGGFHILVNGLLAGLLAPLVRGRSIYFCGGGPLELIGGGFYSDNGLFDLLQAPDPVLERKLIKAVDQIDLVVTMGPRAITYFRDQGLKTRFTVIPGGIDQTRYQKSEEPKVYDLILVGQLIEIKRVDLFLRAVKCLCVELPAVSAAIVGAGRLEADLKRLAGELQIEDQVTFAGYQSDVASWLNRSKVFVLTSESEGLSLAMMEAMMCGLPCVVPDVGELGELIDHGKNGYLVNERECTPEAFGNCLVSLLKDDETWAAFSRAARESALTLGLETTTRRWDGALTDFS